MPSASYRQWRTVRASALDDIASARPRVTGSRRSHRHSTQQIIRAYALMLASQFQGFCRDFHSECADHFIRVLAPPHRLRPLLRDELTRGRQLDCGNPQPSSLGADFGRLGVDFWDELESHAPTCKTWKSGLELLNDWRNAIAHQDFTSPRLGGTMNLRFVQVARWRTSCKRLARAMDEVMHRHLQSLTGTSPW